jgi:hypothetical protein
MWQPSDDVVKKLQQLYLDVEGLLEGANEKSTNNVAKKRK